MSNKYVCCACIAVIANLAVSSSKFSYMFITLCFVCLMIALTVFRLLNKKTTILFITVWLIFSFLRAYTDNQNISLIPLKFAEQPIYSIGVIYNQPERDGDRVQLKIKIDSIHNGSEKIKTNEIVMANIYLSKEHEIAQAQQLSRGQTVSLEARLKQPQVAQNYNQFNYRTYLERNRIHWLFQINSLSHIQIISEERNIGTQILYAFDRFKEKLYRPFKMLFDDKHAGYLGGLVFGMKAELDAELFTSFSKLGLTHILAVSGMHVAVVVACLLLIFKLFKVPYQLSYTLTIAFLPIYIIITGAEPSIIRAGIMGIIGLWLAKHQKLKNTATILALAALIMMTVDPLVIYNIGFQLSFIVTYGLILFTIPLRQAFPERPKYFNDLLSVTLSAQLTSFPLTIFYFNTFNPLSIIANLLLVPYISFIILPLATLTNLLAHISLVLAKPLAYATTFGNQLSFFVIDKLNDLGNFNLIWESPSLLWMVLWYGAIYALINLAAQVRNIKTYSSVQKKHLYRFSSYRILHWSLAVFIVLLLIFAYKPTLFSNNQEGQVSFISIGQGDSILIQTPEQKFILVDSGGQIPYIEKEAWAIREQPFDVGTSILLPILKKRGVQALDIVVISHFDVDHYQGLISLLDEVKIKEIWLNGTVKEDEEMDKFFAKIKGHHIPIKMVRQGDSSRIDEYTELDVLWPTKEAVISEHKQNEQSIVLLLRMHQAKFLLTGDIGEATERDIVYWMNAQKYKIADIDVLKLAHHGSKYSTSLHILSYFNPKLAVVSVGKDNRYGHPHRDVLQKLKYYQIPLLRTDEDGEIIFIVQKNSIRLLLWKE